MLGLLLIKCKAATIWMHHGQQLGWQPVLEHYVTRCKTFGTAHLSTKNCHLDGFARQRNRQKQADSSKISSTFPANQLQPRASRAQDHGLRLHRLSRRTPPLQATTRQVLRSLCQQQLLRSLCQQQLGAAKQRKSDMESARCARTRTVAGRCRSLA